MSAVQFQRQLGLTRYETAFQILHKLRASMVRPDQDLIALKGSILKRMKLGLAAGRAAKVVVFMTKVLVACAVEVRQRKPNSALKQA